jgi:hypothetical protein
MAKQLFSNLDYLEEKPSDVDALGYKDEVTHVKMRIDRLVKKNKHSIVAYLGPFGVGKSTVLRGVQKQTKNYNWVTFEMWRYSNRNELWDAFVIKLAAELTTGKDESEIADEVEGTSLNRLEWPLVLVWVACVWFGLTALSIIAWLSFKDGIGVGGQFWEAYLKYAAPTILPILILVGLGKFLQLSFITNKRPLRRVFELESMLFNKMKKMKKPLVVVVEDVDRSSEDGAIFLETLNHFLRSLKSNSTPFIVMAPQSTRAFNKFDDHSYKGLETTLKIYDEKIYFNSLVSDESLVKFYSDLGVDPVWKDQLTQATQAIISAHRKFITIRLLKHALREVVQFTEMNPDINPVIALAIILSRYVEVPDGVNNLQPALSTLDSHQEFGSGGAKAFFIAIALGIGKYEQANQAQMFVLNFTSSGEPTSDLVTHPNASKQFTINIGSIYGFLVI